MVTYKNYLIVILLSILVIRTVAVVARYQREISAARERINSLGSQVIVTACGPIEYARVGDGYPVLVVHGLMGGFDQGLIHAEFLDSKYQAIAVSRFGYLRSPMPEDADFNLQADIYACLLNELNISNL
jgi:2-hydroxy-6-oxonona-2,4-dienedioate hydrolase